MREISNIPKAVKDSLEEFVKANVSFNTVSCIFDKGDDDDKQSVPILKLVPGEHGNINTSEERNNDGALSHDGESCNDEKWYKLDMQEAHRQYRKWRLEVLSGNSTPNNDAHNTKDQTHYRHNLGAACPPGSPADRLAASGITISSYLLGPPSKEMTCGPSDLTITDQRRKCPTMGNQIQAQQQRKRIEEDNSSKLKAAFEIACPPGSKVEKLVQWGWDIRKYLVNDESKKRHIYDVIVRPIGSGNVSETGQKKEKLRLEKKTGLRQRCFNIVVRLRSKLNPTKNK